MATVTTRPTNWNRDESQRRVAHPLARLRGYIRTYVAAEGLAVFLLYLGLWFWVGLLLDYGVFKLFALDWVQVLPRPFRAGVLCVLVAGLVAVVAVKVFLRLFREFRAPALALVLERRFPGLLGDRLITAVEMADPELAARYNYSQAMIDQTIRDAAEGVEQVPVAEVFNWKRLSHYWLAVLLVTVGFYVLAGAGYCLVKRTADVGGFFHRFNDVAVIWFERNILLLDTIWPRRAHLEMVGFPESGDLRIGRDAPPPTLRARAWRWVLADTNRERAPEGWRPLLWTDLKPELTGGDLPAVTLPHGWGDHSMDWVELQLDKPEGQAQLSADQVLGLRTILEKLDESAANPKMSRRLRKLELPAEVTIFTRGATGSSEQNFQKERDNEYSVTLADLKESVRFHVRGEDYYTPWQKITVVPPPTVVELSHDDDQPAYLYHPVPLDARPEKLRGKKQKFRHVPVSLAGDTSVVAVPAGTDLTLTAVTDKDLKEPGGVRVLPPKPGAPAVNVAVVQAKAREFQTHFDKITAPIDLLFEFVDTDNVVGRRHVVIKPGEDQPPEVDVQVEVLRKVAQGYLCTPVALVPFSGKVRDDWGLASVEWAYTVTRLESDASVRTRSLMVATAVSWGFGGLGQKLASAGVLAALERPAAQEEKAPLTEALATFGQALKKKGSSDILLAQLDERLQGDPPQRPLLKDHNLDPEQDQFNLKNLGLLERDENKAQPHYRVRLWVTAADNNVETGPRSAESKEKFTLLVVSENELLNEIGKEEEGLHVKLEETVNRLRDAQTKLEAVITELPGLKKDEFSPMARRAEEIEEAIAKAEDVTREVSADYNRILKEVKTNGVRADYVSKVQDRICEPLEAAINGEFGQAEETIRQFKAILDAQRKADVLPDKDKRADVPAGEQAKDRLQKLIARLQGVLDNMGDIITFNKLVKTLVELQKNEEEELAKLKRLHEEKIKDLFNDAAPEEKK